MNNLNHPFKLDCATLEELEEFERGYQHLLLSVGLCVSQCAQGKESSCHLSALFWGSGNPVPIS